MKKFEKLSDLSKYLQERKDTSKSKEPEEGKKLETRKTKLTHNDVSNDEAQDPLRLILEKITKLEEVNFISLLNLFLRKLGLFIKIK